MLAKKKIRILVVEDSLVNLGLLKGILAEDSDFEVIGVAKNGYEAIRFVAANMPDVVSMDIDMPLMDGVVATRQIMQRTPVPIVIVSSHYNPSMDRMLFSILEAGALTILQRPYGPGHADYQKTARSYRNTLKMMSEVKVKAIIRYPDEALGLRKTPETGTRPSFMVKNSGHSGFRTKSAAGTVPEYDVIAIGASAGGPQVIQYILKSLPSSLPVPVMVVQHIDANFAEGFGEWLGMTSALPVHIARNGNIMQPGHVYLPPGDQHIGIQRKGIIAVTKDPPENSLRPAVSYLFRDIHSAYGRNAICILLSGMGSDGAAELKMLYDRGACTLVQDAKSALVYGMPGEAVRLGGASRVLPPEEIVNEIIKSFHR